MKDSFKWHPPTLPDEKRKVLVFGTRSFDDYDLFCEKMDAFTKNFWDIAIITGGCKHWSNALGRYVSPDLFAEQWAYQRGFTVFTFFPDIEKHGSPAAFHIRNREMVEFTAMPKRGVAVGWHDGKSAGTKSMIQLVKKFGVKLKVVEYEDD